MSLNTTWWKRLIFFGNLLKNDSVGADPPLSDGQILQYNAASNYFKPTTVPTSSDVASIQSQITNISEQLAGFATQAQLLVFAPLFVQSKDITFTGDDAAHTMFSFNVPAGTLGSTGVIVIDFIITRTVGSSTINFTSTFGGTATSAVTISNGTSTICRVRLAANNATNAQRLTLNIVNGSNSAALTIDSTVDKTLSVEATSIASGNSIRVDSVFAWLEKQ